MSELIQKNDNRATIRWKLLTGTSALALAAYVSSVAVVRAEEASKPLIWIEVGGQWERQTGQGHVYKPGFILDYPDSPAFNPVSPLHYERPPLFSQGFEGALTFQPQDSKWRLSASVRYGRSGGRKNAVPGFETEHRTHSTIIPKGHFSLGHFIVTVPPVVGYVTIPAQLYAPVQSDNKQVHTIVDFSAGRDVGLGIWAHDASGTLSAGVRFAQFQSNTLATIHARPDAEFGHLDLSAFWHNFAHVYPSLPFLLANGPYFHTFEGRFQAERDFKGVGPSISWKASMPIAGNPSDETLSIDWGINAALLFGRQRMRENHQTSGHYHKAGKSSNYYTAGGIPFTRSRNVTIPNVGGMIGMSVNFPNAKVSIGYRGDFFFGAMDTGNDTRRTGRTGFYGPFASISVGLGD